jgi:hypothetical protein
MKRTVFIVSCLTAFLSACGEDGGKQKQMIDFGEIAPQLLRDSSLLLQIAASSGLPVFFASWDPSVAVIEGDRVRFVQAGTVNITAYQPGNEQFYEAPEIMRLLIIRDWDPGKKIQTIRFDLPGEWKISRDGQALRLTATSSSGLPVAYTLRDTKYARFFQSGSTLYFYHAGEGGAPPDKVYDVQIAVVASQSGNEEYNPADNVTRTIRVIGDVFH